MEVLPSSSYIFCSSPQISASMELSSHRLSFSTSLVESFVNKTPFCKSFEAFNQALGGILDFIKNNMVRSMPTVDGDTKGCCMQTVTAFAVNSTFTCGALVMHIQVTRHDHDSSIYLSLIMLFVVSASFIIFIDETKTHPLPEVNTPPPPQSPSLHHHH